MSWKQLQAMITENRAQAEQTASEAPMTCPIDGALLNINSRGERDCPMGNYRWTGGVSATPTSV